MSLGTRRDPASASTTSDATAPAAAQSRLRRTGDSAAGGAGERCAGARRPGRGRRGQMERRERGEAARRRRAGGRLLERGGEGARRGPALGGRLGQAAPQHRGERGRHLGRRGLRHRLLHVLHEDGHRGRPRVGHPAGEALERHHAEGVDVGGVVHLPPHGLLGGHVGRGALDEAGGGGDRRALEHLRDAEVGEVGAAGLVEQHVGRLHVPVDDPLAVRVVEGTGHVAQERRRLARGERRAPHPVGQGAAPHEAHGHPGPPALDPVGVDRDDVGVLQLRRDARLLAEALGEGGVVEELRGQDLQGHAAVERGVVRLVDGGHAAPAERGDDAVRSECRSGLEVHEGRLPREASG